MSEARPAKPSFLLLSPFCDEVWSDVSPGLSAIGDVTIARLSGRRTIEDHAAAVAALMDERSCILGFCAGGVVALAAARLMPKPPGIILISATPLADTEMQRRARLAKIGRLQEKAERGGTDDDGSYAEAALAWMLSSRSLAHEPTRIRSRDILGELTPRMALDNHLAMLSRPDLGAEFLRLGNRLSLLIGERDRILDVKSVIDLAARAPGLRSVVSRDCGHLIPVEAPELVVDAAKDWTTANGFG